MLELILIGGLSNGYVSIEGIPIDRNNSITEAVRNWYYIMKNTTLGGRARKELERKRDMVSKRAEDYKIPHTLPVSGSMTAYIYQPICA